MMLCHKYPPPQDYFLYIFARCVPEDHYLLQLRKIIDFERFRPLLNPSYSLGEGRPPFDPVFMLKLDLLGYHYGLSDRELMKQLPVNMAFRLFLDWGAERKVPHHTSMTYFRNRIGEEALKDIFHGVLGQAREMGLVKDRLRLKDATHVLANIAVPSTIRLVAETRDRLLEATDPFAPAYVKEQWDHALQITKRTEDLADVERLLQRVDHLRSLVQWADEFTKGAMFRDAAAADQENLRTALELAHKVLADREDAKAGDKVLSTQDPDARCGKHGGFYDGYMLDVTTDADSQLITGINVLPANGNEGQDAAHLIQEEEKAHGNDVEAISIDGAGYNGEVLRELTNPEGLNMEVFTPPTTRIPLTVFGPEEFKLSEDRKTLTCPAGQTTTHHERNGNDTGEKFRFSKKQCSGCTMREKCLATPTTRSRSVIKNDYEAEYKAAQAKAQTAEYAKVRKEHPAIERKLSELVNRHGMRHARYRGISKVRRQALATGMVVNLKRIVKLRTQVAAGVKRTEIVRAELVKQG